MAHALEATTENLDEDRRISVNSIFGLSNDENEQEGRLRSADNEDLTGSKNVAVTVANDLENQVERSWEDDCSGVGDGEETLGNIYGVASSFASHREPPTSHVHRTDQHNASITFNYSNPDIVGAGRKEDAEGGGSCSQIFSKQSSRNSVCMNQIVGEDKARASTLRTFIGTILIDVHTLQQEKTKLLSHMHSIHSHAIDACDALMHQQAKRTLRFRQLNKHLLSAFSNRSANASSITRTQSETPTLFTPTVVEVSPTHSNIQPSNAFFNNSRSSSAESPPTISNAQHPLSQQVAVNSEVQLLGKSVIPSTLDSPFDDSLQSETNQSSFVAFSNETIPPVISLSVEHSTIDFSSIEHSAIERSAISINHLEAKCKQLATFSSQCIAKIQELMEQRQSLHEQQQPLTPSIEVSPLLHESNGELERCRGRLSAAQLANAQSEHQATEKGREAAIATSFFFDSLIMSTRQSHDRNVVVRAAHQLRLGMHRLELMELRNQVTRLLEAVCSGGGSGGSSGDPFAQLRHSAASSTQLDKIPSRLNQSIAPLPTQPTVTPLVTMQTLEALHSPSHQLCGETHVSRQAWAKSLESSVQRDLELMGFQLRVEKRQPPHRHRI